MKTKTTFLALLALTLTLTVGCILGIGASAEETAPTVEYSNVAYNDMMHLVFTVKDAGAIPDGATAGIIIWDKAQEEYTVAKARYATFTARKDGDTTYYRSYGIAATEIDTKIYISAGYILDGVITATQTPIEYSIVDYLVSRLNSDVTDVQSRLYYNVLAYGLASDAVLGGDLYTLVKSEGGYVGNHNRVFGIVEDASDKIMLRAQAVNADGKYFAKWVDEDGNTVSTDRVCMVAPGKGGEVVYTAVFDTKANGVFTHAVGFDTVAAGEIAFPEPDLSSDPTSKCYGIYSNSNYRCYLVENKTLLSSLTLQNYHLPDATQTGTTNDDKFTMNLDENGNHVIIGKDNFYIVEMSEGDNVLEVVKNQKAIAWNAIITNAAGKGKTVEFDVGCDDIRQDGVQLCFGFRLNAGGVTSNYRMNFNADDGTDSVCLYIEQKTSGQRDDNILKLDGKISSFYFGKDKLNTISLTLNTSGEKPCFDFYINSEYAGSLNCELFDKEYNESYDYANANITRLIFSSVSNTLDTFYVDNVAFK